MKTVGDTRGKTESGSFQYLHPFHPRRKNLKGNPMKSAIFKSAIIAFALLFSTPVKSQEIALSAQVANIVVACSADINCSGALANLRSLGLSQEVLNNALAVIAAELVAVAMADPSLRAIVSRTLTSVALMSTDAAQAAAIERVAVSLKDPSFNAPLLTLPTARAISPA